MLTELTMHRLEAVTKKRIRSNRYHRHPAPDENVSKIWFSWCLNGFFNGSRNCQIVMNDSEPPEHQTPCKGVVYSGLPHHPWWRSCAMNQERPPIYVAGRTDVQYFAKAIQAIFAQLPSVNYIQNIVHHYNQSLSVLSQYGTIYSGSPENTQMVHS